MSLAEAVIRFTHDLRNSIIEPVPPELDEFASAVLKGEVPMLLGSHDIDLHRSHIEVHIPLHPCSNGQYRENVFVAMLQEDGTIVISHLGTQTAKHLFF